MTDSRARPTSVWHTSHVLQLVLRSQHVLIAGTVAAVLLTGCGRQQYATGGTQSPVPSLDPATQRAVAIYSAVLRYDIDHVVPLQTVPPATAGAAYNVLNDTYALVTATGGARPTGAIPSGVQAGIISALRPTALAFVSSAAAVALPPTPGACAPIAGRGWLFTLGDIPPGGDEVAVYSRADSSVVKGPAWLYDVKRTTAGWAVAGSVETNRIESLCG